MKQEIIILFDSLREKVNQESFSEGVKKKIQHGITDLENNIRTEHIKSLGDE